MSLTVPYATVEEYMAAIDKKDGDTSRIQTALLDASRIIDSGYGRAPGTFLPADAASERLFDGNGSQRLVLRDSIGVHAFTTVTSVAVDGAAVTYTPEPRNAAAFGMAYEELARPSGSTWTKGTANVAVTATWGFAEVPGQVRQLCIKVARDIAEAHIAGPRGEIYMLDSGITVRGDTWRLWNKLAHEPWFMRRMPVVA